MPGHGAAEVGAALEQGDDPAAGAHGQPAGGQRHRRRDGRGHGGEAERRPRGGGQGRPVEGGRGARRHPVAQAGQRDDEGQADEGPERQQRRAGERAEGDRADGAGGAAAGAGVAPPSAQPDLGEQQEQAEQHQDAGQHRGAGAVEGGAVLVVDGGGERRVAQHLQRAELGEQVQGDQQAAAEQGHPQLRQLHPAGTPPSWRAPGRARSPPAPGRDRGRPRPPAGRRTGSRRASPPGARRRRCPGRAAARSTRSCSRTPARPAARPAGRARPGGPGTDERSTSHAAPTPRTTQQTTVPEHEAGGVPEQLAHPRAEHQLLDARPADVDRVPGDVAQR